jgi:hypothetical protein
MSLLKNLNISSKQKRGMDRESLLAQIREQVAAAGTRS